YQLRRTLGADAIVSEGDEAMGVDHTRVWCDVRAFDTAVEERRWADALELYHGDFLTGVHLADAAPELEDWISAERTRLRRAPACVARRGAPRGAGHWRRSAGRTPARPCIGDGARRPCWLTTRLRCANWSACSGGSATVWRRRGSTTSSRGGYPRSSASSRVLSSGAWRPSCAARYPLRPRANRRAPHPPRLARPAPPP